jgi:hypothetical protein
MRKRNLVVGLTAIGATLALGVSAAISAGPGGSVNVQTTLTIGAVGYQGKVKATNSNCVAERTVVLKQKGYGVLSRVESKENGNWKADLDEMNANFKGPLPYRVFAEVKPLTQATAGPIYKCLAATSKTITIAGG